MHTNKINGKKYIGLTGQDPQKRWGKNGKGYTKDKQSVFRRAIDKYGWNNFEHSILYNNLTQEEACQKEIELIKKYDTQNPEYGYNIQCGGNLGNLGRIMSSETKQKLSEAHKGKKLTKEHKKHISEGTKGHKPCVHSKETKQKLSEINKVKIIPQETRDKISNTLKGIKRSDETKKKMKENNSQCVKVYCPELDIVFPTIADGARYTGTYNANIQKVLNGERNYAGRHKITNEKLHWIKVK